MTTGVTPRAARRPIGAGAGTGTDAAPAALDAGTSRAYARMAALLVALMIAFSVAPILNSFLGKPNKDYNLWYWTGRVILGGGEVYPKDPHRLFPFMYPPSCAAMLAAASTLGEQPFVIGLTMLNSAGWIASIMLAVYLATGQALRRRPLLYLLPTAVVVPYVHDTYLLGQPNLLLLALMLGACACLRHRRDWAAGSLVAVAAAIKAFPVLAVCYLVYRRRWKATIATVLALAILVLVVPMAFRGPKWAWDDAVTWTKGMVLKYDAGSIAQRPERCYSFKNQSMVALANRLLRSIPADGEKDDRWKVNLADLDFKTVNAIIAACGLGLCLFYVTSMPRAARRTPRTDAIEQAMLLLLILMFSPLSFNYFYVWLIYPLTLALNLVYDAPAGTRMRSVRLAWLCSALVVFALALPFLRSAQAYGNLFFTSLILLLGFGCELRRVPAVVPESGTGGLTSPHSAVPTGGMLAPS